MSRFDTAFDLVLGFEGGYSNDPRDPGGETNWGISKRSYPHLDIKNLTEQEAKEIYRTDYWDAAECDFYPSPLATIVFDCAVNQGVMTAKKLMQRTLGVTEDGIIGPVTKAAMFKKNVVELAALFLAQRALQYTKTKNFDIYGKGWLKRLFMIAIIAQ